jgi:L-histidine Nalpha-methyltransferase / hercynylcysteine S-oxide synthase
LEAGEYGTDGHASGRSQSPSPLISSLTTSRNLRKVGILLAAFEQEKKAIEYYALDLSLPELYRTLSAVPTGTYQYVKCFGLHGTYDDGLAWLQRTQAPTKATCVLSLGSSIGNFSRNEAAKFLHQFSRVLGRQDSLIIGLDSCQDAQQIFEAYNDSKGVTEAFYRNGLTHANRLLGYEGFKQDEWDVVGVFDEKLHCHEAHYVALSDIDVNGIQILKGTKLHLETAYKYSTQQMRELWQASGLVHQAAFGNKSGDYSKLRSCKALKAFDLQSTNVVSHSLGRSPLLRQGG